MTVRLAIGASVTVMKRVVGILYTLTEVQYDDEFIVLDLGDKFDIILDLPCLRRYEPQVSCYRRSIDMPTACSSNADLMNVLERPPTCGCITSECDGLACSSVVRTTAQDRNVASHHSMEQYFGDCVETQGAPKDHHWNKLSGQGHKCPPNANKPRNNQPVANDWHKMLLHRLEIRTLRTSPW